MVLNRIEQKERERDEAARRAEDERRRQEESQRQAQIRAQREAQRKQEERLQFVRNQTQYALTASGVLHGLEEIRDGRLARAVRKYALVVNLDSGYAELVWGNKFSVQNNVVTAERGNIDYQGIRVVVNPDTLELSISGSSLRNYSEKQWQNDPGVVLDGLAEAYLSPKRYTNPPPSSYSGSYSEGCC